MYPVIARTFLSAVHVLETTPNATTMINFVLAASRLLKRGHGTAACAGAHPSRPNRGQQGILTIFVPARRPVCALGGSQVQRRNVLTAELPIGWPGNPDHSCAVP